MATEASAAASSMWDMFRAVPWHRSPRMMLSPFSLFDDPFADLPLFPAFAEPSWFDWPRSALTRFPRLDFGLHGGFDTWCSKMTHAFDTMIRSRFEPNSAWGENPTPGQPQSIQRSFDENGLRGREGAQRVVVEPTTANGGLGWLCQTYYKTCEGTAPTLSQSQASESHPPKWEITSVTKADQDDHHGSLVETAKTLSVPLWGLAATEEPEDMPPVSSARAVTQPTSDARPSLSITEGLASARQDSESDPRGTGPSSTTGTRSSGQRNRRSSLSEGLQSTA
jgi:hypothetical protein